jgi:hypothetical protein
LKHIRTETTMAAPIEKVWATLTDFNAYPRWNPFITRLTGDISEGGKVEARLMGMTINPRIERLEENTELRWVGHLGVPGIFDGEHYFRIEANKDGSTRFVHGERFTGVLVPIFSLIGQFKKIERAFVGMNEALKARVEGVQK